MTQKWGEMQGKWELVRVSGEVRVTGVLLIRMIFDVLPS